MSVECYLNVMSFITEEGKLNIIDEKADYLFTIENYNYAGSDEFLIYRDSNPEVWNIIAKELSGLTLIAGENTHDEKVWLGIDDDCIFFSIVNGTNNLKAKIPKNNEFSNHITRIMSSVKRSMSSENRSKETIYLK
jgi:hypothetical protein